MLFTNFRFFQSLPGVFDTLRCTRIKAVSRTLISILVNNVYTWWNVLLPCVLILEKQTEPKGVKTITFPLRN